MKAGIYDPYLETLGGGEKYCLTLAEYLLTEGWQVDLFWEGEDLKKKIEERFQIDVKRVNFVPMQKSLLEKLLIHPKYDLLFYLSDGSVPFMFGKRNILHLQVPFKRVNGQSLINKIKFLTINKIVCNSQFTKKVIDKEFGISSEVIYPPIDIKKFNPGEKENLIISVGRFSKLLQTKNQALLIEAFKNLVDCGLRGWRLVLAGGSEVGSGDLVSRLREMANDYPIEILENISFNKLSGLYAEAKMFWAASGYGVDEEEYPEKVEHFGIAAAEAMSAGAVPLLVVKGGFKEIIEEGKSGYFWETTKELEERTLELTRADLAKLQASAIKRSKIFSKEKFNEKFKEIIF